MLFWKPQAALFVSESTLLSVLVPFAPVATVIDRFPTALEAVLRAQILRHSAAAALIAAEGSPKAAQTILGYASAAFTLTTYGHMLESDLDALAGRLDALVREAPATFLRPPSPGRFSSAGQN